MNSLRSCYPLLKISQHFCANSTTGSNQNRGSAPPLPHGYANVNTIKYLRITEIFHNWHISSQAALCTNEHQFDTSISEMKNVTILHVCTVINKDRTKKIPKRKCTHHSHSTIWNFHGGIRKICSKRVRENSGNVMSTTWNEKKEEMLRHFVGENRNNVSLQSGNFVGIFFPVFLHPATVGTTSCFRVKQETVDQLIVTLEKPSIT